MSNNYSLLELESPYVEGKFSLLLHFFSFLKYMDRTNPMDKHMEVMINRYGMAAAPAAPQMFGNAGREHMEKYGKHIIQTKQFLQTTVGMLL